MKSEEIVKLIDNEFLSKLNDKQESNQDIVKKALKNEDIISFIEKNNISNFEIAKNINLFINYDNETKICKNCRDFNSCKLKNMWFCPILKYENKTIYLEYDFCKFYKEISLRNSLFLINDIQFDLNDLKKSNFDNFSKTKFNIIKELYKNFKKQKTDDFYFIYGDKKSGKSFLVSTFFNEYLMKNKINGIYADCVSRIQELNDLSFIDKIKFNDLLKEYKTCSVLVLDNFSYCSFNDYKRDTILIPILNERIKNGLLTIIISDYDIENTINAFSTKDYKSLKNKSLVNVLKNTFKEMEIKEIEGLY